MDFDLEDPLFSKPAAMLELFSSESDHMCQLHNLRFQESPRQDAASLILQAQFCCSDLDSYVVYLAINYSDRFLSTILTQRNKNNKPWMVHLLSIACLSLASKMSKAHFPMEDFQREEIGVVYELKKVRRMEVVVLGALQWRMRSITPFSFFAFLLSFFACQESALMSSIKARASHIVFALQIEMKLFNYKPSVIAASAILTATNEIFPLEFSSFLSSITSFSFINKEEVLKCYNLMKDELGSCGCPASSSSHETPASVLDFHHHHRCLSCSESDVATDLAKDQL